MVWLLALVSLVGYALRTNIAIAQEYMAPELGLSMTQMGVISAWGFQFAYAAFQIPGGFLGDRYGARVILTLAVLGWSVASLASGSVVGSASVAFGALFLARVVLGASEAATYPVSAMAVAQTVPEKERVAASAIYLAAGSLGAGLAPLLLAPLMVKAGWRAVFLASAVVGVVTAVVWYLFAPRRTERSGTHRYVPIEQQMRDAARLLRNRPLLVLACSYVLHSAVFFVFIFWFFRYLTEARGFSVLASGVWGSVPHFMSVIIAPAVGVIADRLARRMAPDGARRRVAMICQTVAALFVLIGANLPTPTLAILALGLSTACLVSTEAPYWTTATALASDLAGSAGGILNLMGNLGGVLSIWLTPIMKDAWGWTAMLAFWAGVALVAAMLWWVVGRLMHAPGGAMPNATYSPSIASVSQETT